MEFELKVEHTRTWDASLKRSSVWLLLDGKAVAWAVIEDAPVYEGYICLCDIETRPGFQGKGYARKIMELISETMGKPLGLTGSLTPEGWNALHGKLPILPTYKDPAGPTFRSMTFVDDWDKFYAPS